MGKRVKSEAWKPKKDRDIIQREHHCRIYQIKPKLLRDKIKLNNGKIRKNKGFTNAIFVSSSIAIYI